MVDIRKNIAELCLPPNVTLIAVTKGVKEYRIKEAAKWGVKHIGESYVQEAEDKFPYIKRTVKWHMIGHLQRNKVKNAVRIFDVIQSVDSIKLAKKIDKEAGKQEKIIDILLQVNISGDKHGFEPEDVLKAVREVRGLKYINLTGLMAIGGIENPELSFKKMHNLFRKSGLKHLSMGMSNDYELAVKHGANIVRIGTRIFGRRYC